MINAKRYIKWVFIYTLNLSSHSHFDIPVTKEGDVEELSHQNLHYRTSSFNLSVFTVDFTN